MQFATAAATHDEPGCLLWPYKQNGHGYGSLWVNGSAIQAHRFVLRLAKGDPPDESYEAAHAPLICHNRLCVNPAHLRWATRSANQRDRSLDDTWGPQQRRLLAETTPTKNRETRTKK